MGCLALWPRRKQHGSDASHVSLSVDKEAARILEATDEAAKADPWWPPPTPPAAAVAAHAERAAQEASIRELFARAADRESLLGIAQWQSPWLVDLHARTIVDTTCEAASAAEAAGAANGVPVQPRRLTFGALMWCSVGLSFAGVMWWHTSVLQPAERFAQRYIMHSSAAQAYLERFRAGAGVTEAWAPPALQRMPPRLGWDAVAHWHMLTHTAQPAASTSQKTGNAEKQQHGAAMCASSVPLIAVMVERMAVHDEPFFRQSAQLMTWQRVCCRLLTMLLLHCFARSMKCVAIA
jgi:hypothetical protein